MGCYTGTVSDQQNTCRILLCLRESLVKNKDVDNDIFIDNHKQKKRVPRNQRKIINTKIRKTDQHLKDTKIIFGTDYSSKTEEKPNKISNYNIKNNENIINPNNIMNITTDNLISIKTLKSNESLNTTKVQKQSKIHEIEKCANIIQNAMQMAKTEPVIRDVTHKPTEKLHYSMEFEKTSERLAMLSNVNSPTVMENVIHKQYIENQMSDSDHAYVASIDLNKGMSNESELSLTDKEEIAQAIIERDFINEELQRKRKKSYKKIDGSRRHLYRGTSEKQWEDEHLLKTYTDMELAADALKQLEIVTDEDIVARSIMYNISDFDETIIDLETEVDNIKIMTLNKPTQSELYRMESDEKWSDAKIDKESNELQKQLAHLAFMKNSNNKLPSVEENDD